MTTKSACVARTFFSFSGPTQPQGTAKSRRISRSATRRVTFCLLGKRPPVAMVSRTHDRVLRYDERANNDYPWLRSWSPRVLGRRAWKRKRPLLASLLVGQGA